MDGLFPVICCEDVDASARFYSGLLGLGVAFESGWYTLLRPPGPLPLPLGLVLRGHPSVPQAFQRAPQGSS